MNRTILTFDYELFLGVNSGTVEKTLLQPTNRILEILKINNVSGIFFVDLCFLLFLKKNKCKDFLIVKKQLQDAILLGNKIEIHMHPQWVDAYVNNDGSYSFKSFERYRLHALSSELLVSLFDESYHLLNDIVHEVLPNYQISAFRAGGWCIEPFSIIRPLFLKYNIRYDFSVLPGAYQNSIQLYDYRETPKKDIWRFSTKPTCEDANGEFIEVSCVRYSQYGLISLLNKMIKSKDKNTDVGLPLDANAKRNYMEYLISCKDYYLTIDYTSPFIFNFFVKKKWESHEVLSVFSHPKSFNKDSEVNLKYLLSNSDIVGFDYIQDIYSY